MKDLERLLNPEKRFLEYQDYLIDLIASSYHKNFKDLIATRIKDAFYFFDSIPDVTYQFIKKFNPNIKNLIKYYLLNKNYKLSKIIAESLVNNKYYYPYVKKFLNISDKYFKKNKNVILGLNFEAFSNEYKVILQNPNLHENIKEIIRTSREGYLEKCKSIGLEPITDENKIQNYLDFKEMQENFIKKYIIIASSFGESIIEKLNIKNYSFSNSIESIVSKIVYIDNCTAITYSAWTTQNKRQVILSLPVLKNHLQMCLDICALHELVHISENELYSIFHWNYSEKYKIFNEFRTQEKTLKLFSKLRQDNIHIFDQDNNDDNTYESAYDKFITLINPLLDNYRELIDYCAITNKVSPIYKNLGRENFDNYCKSLSTLFNEVMYISKLLNKEDKINISTEFYNTQIEKMKTYSKRNTIK